MLNYIKTAQGIQALEQRQHSLNARQRRLLVLIGSPDFQHMSPAMLERFAPSDLVEQLQNLGFITTQVNDHTQIKITSPTTSTKPEATLDHTVSTRYLNAEKTSTLEQAPNSNAHHPALEITLSTAPHGTDKESFVTQKALDVTELKFTMIQLLQRNCGLMAKQLIHDIEHAKDVKKLRICQIQWLTLLQESKIPPAELKQQLRIINFSLSYWS